MERREWLKATSLVGLAMVGLKWGPRGKTLAEAVASCPNGGTIHIPRGTWSNDETIPGMRVFPDSGEAITIKGKYASTWHAWDTNVGRHK